MAGSVPPTGCPRSLGLVIPSLLALLLGLVNGEELLRSTMRAALAGALIVAWYALLVSAVRGAVLCCRRRQLHVSRPAPPSMPRRAERDPLER
ncbi:MAG TPA: hypothetical protein VFH74_02760 [Gaiellales bacterium]|nr:hypothetical protein [Gaiellales bacterium]